jgi:hypothetical protein
MSLDFSLFLDMRYKGYNEYNEIIIQAYKEDQLEDLFFYLCANSEIPQIQTVTKIVIRRECSTRRNIPAKQIVLLAYLIFAMPTPSHFYLRGPTDSYIGICIERKNHTMLEILLSHPDIFYFKDGDDVSVLDMADKGGDEKIFIQVLTCGQSVSIKQSTYADNLTSAKFSGLYSEYLQHPFHFCIEQRHKHDLAPTVYIEAMCKEVIGRISEFEKKLERWFKKKGGHKNSPEEEATRKFSTVVGRYANLFKSKLLALKSLDFEDVREFQSEISFIADRVKKARDTRTWPPQMKETVDAVDTILEFNQYIHGEYFNRALPYLNIIKSAKTLEGVNALSIDEKMDTHMKDLRSLLIKLAKVTKEKLEPLQKRANLAQAGLFSNIAKVADEFPTFIPENFGVSPESETMANVIITAITECVNAGEFLKENFHLIRPFHDEDQKFFVTGVSNLLGDIERTKFVAKTGEKEEIVKTCTTLTLSALAFSLQWRMKLFIKFVDTDSQEDYELSGSDLGYLTSSVGMMDQVLKKFNSMQKNDAKRFILLVLLQFKDLSDIKNLFDKIDIEIKSDAVFYSAAGSSLLGVLRTLLEDAKSCYEANKALFSGDSSSTNMMLVIENALKYVIAKKKYYIDLRNPETQAQGQASSAAPRGYLPNGEVVLATKFRDPGSFKVSFLRSAHGQNTKLIVKFGTNRRFEFQVTREKLDEILELMKYPKKTGKPIENFVANQGRLEFIVPTEDGRKEVKIIVRNNGGQNV